MLSTQRYHDKCFTKAINDDFLPEFVRIIQLRHTPPETIEDSERIKHALKLFKEKYKKNIPCPRLDDYNNASENLRMIYDAFHSKIIEFLYD